MVSLGANRTPCPPPSRLPSPLEGLSPPPASSRCPWPAANPGLRCIRNTPNGQRHQLHNTICKSRSVNDAFTQLRPAMVLLSTYRPRHAGGRIGKSSRWHAIYARSRVMRRLLSVAGEAAAFRAMERQESTGVPGKRSDSALQRTSGNSASFLIRKANSTWHNIV